MVMYYHREHTLVQAMRNCADPRHDMIWQQQIQKVIGILHRQGFAWSKDAAIDIDDLAQIALLELVHALPTYHYTSCFSTWAYAVIVRRMKRHLRDRSALKRSGNAVSLNTNCETTVPVATAEQPETIAEGHIFADLIYEVLARQQGMQVAEIFQMWANDDIKLAHIGEHVQCSSSWTRALLNKARTSLQQHPGIQAWLQQSGSSEQSP
jgi:RNA polymerase sigma factor (sigma-70 family)